MSLPEAPGRSGRRVHRAVTIPFEGPARLVVHKVAVATPDQELHLGVEGGRIVLGGRPGRRLHITPAVAPERIELRLEADGPAQLRVWNGRSATPEDPTPGALARPGIVVARSGAGWLLQCSDGSDGGHGDRFCDLVVLLELTALPAPVVDLRPGAEPTRSLRH